MKQRIMVITASILSFMTLSSGLAAAALHIRHHRPHHSISRQQGSLSVAPTDLNTADVKSLTRLKGIGPKKAKAIVAYRQQHDHFKSLADLALVKGISAKSVARLLKNNPNRLIINH